MEVEEDALSRFRSDTGLRYYSIYPALPNMQGEDWYSRFKHRLHLLPDTQM